MGANKTILIGGFLIIGIGVVNAAANKKPETPILAGGLTFILLASVLDALGPGPSKVATALVGLATTTVVISEGGGLVKAIQSIQKKAKTTTL